MPSPQGAKTARNMPHAKSTPCHARGAARCCLVYTLPRPVTLLATKCSKHARSTPCHVHSSTRRLRRNLPARSIQGPRSAPCYGGCGGICQRTERAYDPRDYARISFELAKMIQLNILVLELRKTNSTSSLEYLLELVLATANRRWPSLVS